MKQYYIQLFSPHGLIRAQEPEIGRDKDTGGQVKYVLELMNALSRHERIRKVDLFTRLIKDKRVSPKYAEPIEIVNEKARIVRIACGGNSYRRKEVLWNYLDEFIDQTIRFNKEQMDFPDLIHGHYADGNYIAYNLANFFHVPFFSTGHSLGRNKLKMLLQMGVPEEKINDQFNMKRRIDAEEKAISKADRIITSTAYEVESQYTDYKQLAEGRFVVLPPGLDEELFYPYYRPEMPSFKMSIMQEQALHKVHTEIERFLFDPGKPLILSIGRPDKRKNFETIIEAYGSDKELQTMANLAIFAGVRKDITQMPEEEQEILTNLLLLMDKYDLYGRLAIPKKNDPKLEIPEIYRLAARKKGVFVNATPGENFGLTIVEAAASGLPVIASPTGGPKEILEKCENGILVDVEDKIQVAAAIKKIIGDSNVWQDLSSNGIRGVSEHYSWEAHQKAYLQEVEKILQSPAYQETSKPSINIGKRLSQLRKFLICDLDGTLIEDEPSADLTHFTTQISERRSELIFGIATGRNKVLTEEALLQHNLPRPDIVICSAGSELYYTEAFLPDTGWKQHISYRWNRKKLEQVLSHFPKIKLQEEAAQWEFKLSYYVDADFDEDDLAALYHLLSQNKLKVNVLLTDGLYLDLLPYRASKGNALKYLSYKWKAPLEDFITAGNGGNDMDMLKGRTKGIVVANHSPELKQLQNTKGIYFAKESLYKGVLEGLAFYEK